MRGVWQFLYSQNAPLWGVGGRGGNLTIEIPAKQACQWKRIVIT